MEDILNIDSIKEFNALSNCVTQHPLVSIVNVEKGGLKKSRRVRYGFYTVFFKKVHCGDLRYGLKNYDYEEGTLIFLAPGQAIGQNSEEYIQPQGTALVFHADLLVGTPLEKKMDTYHFFSYAVNEALHLSEEERKIIMDCFSKIEYELRHAIDKHSKQLIVANIELFLGYCTRFYDRQFITREHVNKGVLEKFEQSLNLYFTSSKPDELGLPTVAFFAEEMHLSVNYFGDLIKKETGVSPQEHIQSKIIQIAKSKIIDGGASMSEIAYSLGYKHPQHFSRLFKLKTGVSPNEYRNLN
jgi:AraC-like DNA-binding protein